MVGVPLHPILLTDYMGLDAYRAWVSTLDTIARANDVVKGPHRRNEAYRPSLLEGFSAGILNDARYSDQFHIEQARRRNLHFYCVQGYTTYKEK